MYVGGSIYAEARAARAPPLSHTHPTCMPHIIAIAQLHPESCGASLMGMQRREVRSRRGTRPDGLRYGMYAARWPAVWYARFVACGQRYGMRNHLRYGMQNMQLERARHNNAQSGEPQTGREGAHARAFVRPWPMINTMTRERQVTVIRECVRVRAVSCSQRPSSSAALGPKAVPLSHA